VDLVWGKKIRIGFTSSEEGWKNAKGKEIILVCSCGFYRFDFYD
jgi:hypothetical protein